MNRPSPDKTPFEVDTLRGRAIVYFIVGFVALVALSFWIVEETLSRLNASTPPPAATSLVTTTRPISDAPRLQPAEGTDHSPSEDLEALKSQEDDVLARLGWSVDRGRHQAAISQQLIEHLIRPQQKEARP